MSGRNGWRPADWARVRKHHAPLFRRWKAARGIGTWDAPLVDSPEFTDSLQALYDYGYSLTDIAAMWGVSRERVRQWFEQAGLERNGGGGSEMRLWDWDLGCFVPCSMKEYRAANAAHRRDRRRARRHAVRQRHTDAIRHLAVTLGRPPTLRELGGYLGVPNNDNTCGHIARFWRDGRQPSYTEAMDRMYAAAGVARLSHGEAIHIGQIEAALAAVEEVARDG